MWEDANAGVSLQVSALDRTSFPPQGKHGRRTPASVCFLPLKADGGFGEGCGPAAILQS